MIQDFTIERIPGWYHLPPITVQIDCKPRLGGYKKVGLAVVEAYKQGLDLRGCALRSVYIKDAILPGIDLSGCRMRWCQLDGVDLFKGKFVNTSFRASKIIRVNFGGADLQGAIFKGADLSHSSFIGADMRGARLQRADVLGADFTAADLAGANLTETAFNETLEKWQTVA